MQATAKTAPDLKRYVAGLVRALLANAFACSTLESHVRYLVPAQKGREASASILSTVTYLKSTGKLHIFNEIKFSER